MLGMAVWSCTEGEDTATDLDTLDVSGELEDTFIELTYDQIDLEIELGNIDKNE